MTAVFRLVLTYFAGSPLSRGMTVLGLTLLVTGIATLLYLPPLLGSRGLPSALPLARESLFLSMPLFALLALFLSSTLMPLMFVDMTRSRLLHVLPAGRVKVLASAMITVCLLAIVAGVAVTAQYVRLPIELHLVFLRTVTVTFLTFTLMHLIVWWICRTRSTASLLGGAMLAIATLLFLPIRFIANPAASLLSPLLASVVLWGMLIGAFLMPRFKNIPSVARVGIFRSYRAGSELDLFMGLAKPWQLALGQIVPILIATLFIDQPRIWLFYFTLFSAISGAVTSFAAIRSRALWLRTPWSRAELFAQMEVAFWRNNSYALGTLLLLFTGLGIHLGFDLPLLLLGFISLVLGTAASTYLGLMTTRGIGWFESCAGIVTMALLMGGALLAAKSPVGVAPVIAIEIAVDMLALAFRHLAQRRWCRIDWTQCRPEQNSDQRLRA